MLRSARETRGGILHRLSIASLSRTALSYSTVRYLVVGGLSFLLDLGLLTLFYRGFGVPLALATGIGFWGSVLFNFTLQKRFAFETRGATGRSLWRYGVLLAANSVIAIAVVTLFHSLGWGYVYGKVFVTAAQTVWNYFAYRSWVFAGSGDDARKNP